MVSQLHDLKSEGIEWLGTPNSPREDMGRLLTVIKRKQGQDNDVALTIAGAAHSLPEQHLLPVS